MSDNPFSEPADNDRTVIRPAPGGRRLPTRAADSRPGPTPLATAVLMPEGAESLVVGGHPLAGAAGPLLHLLGRLRNTANPPDSGDLRERTAREIRIFEQRAKDSGVSMGQLRPAHYALCASIDDIVMNTPWGGTGGWDARSLVSTFHQEVRGGDRFFDLLDQMKQNPGEYLPVIELMYMCLSLGFMGRYRLSPRGVGDIDRLREDIYTVIARQRRVADPALSPRWKGIDAPYRPSRAVVPIWVTAAMALAAIGGLFVVISTSLNATSDDLYDRMLQAPPTAMPQITRAAIVMPPAPLPAPQEPTVMDNLRTFLKPEIDQGLVSVLGTGSAPNLRINNRGMFQSGSATLQPAIMPLLERIGLALKSETGRVQVIGYTDNQPIRTVQFASNFQLSTARASAAKTVMSHTVGDLTRIVAEGRADADPIAPNTTAEGREQNRRIEIVLHRQEQ